MIRCTGVGSLPGTSVREAVRIVTGEFPDLVHLPELPARGPGADMVGRAAALLVDVAQEFAVDTTPTGWRLVDTPGVAMRRAHAHWREDLDTFEEACHDATSVVKVQLAGPITLGASIALRRGERVASDEGALRDLVEAHREAVARHLADLRRRLPNAQLVLQVDEPSLDAALRGALRTQSGWRRIPPLEEPQVRAWHTALAAAITAAGVTPWLHSCAPHWPIDLAHAAGYRGLSGDMSLLRDADEDALAAAIEAGIDLVAGVIPTDDVALARPVRSEAATVEPIRRRFARIGFDDRVLARSVVITPTCGLGGCSLAAARTAMARVREAAHVLDDQLEGVEG